MVHVAVASHAYLPLPAMGGANARAEWEIGRCTLEAAAVPWRGFVQEYKQSGMVETDSVQRR